MLGHFLLNTLVFGESGGVLQACLEHFKKERCFGPADGVAVMLLDCHVADRGSSPGSDGLKLMLGMCVCAQNPKRRMEEKGLWSGHFPR